jgi:mannose-6-phosphate isomerase-like protein (cupin superfamily)
MVNEYAVGLSPGRLNPAAEEALYCTTGRGVCHIAGETYDIAEGTGVYIPANTEYAIENPGPGSIRLISVCCPEQEQSRIVPSPASTRRKDPPGQPRTVREQERPAIQSGERQFKLMVNKDLGCEQITQFVGFIPASKAPFHFHPYEEAIYILEGTGIVHTEEESCEFGPGTSIFLPIECSHCLENPGPGTVRLLGAFYPSGSPAVSYRSDTRK